MYNIRTHRSASVVPIYRHMYMYLCMYARIISGHTPVGVGEVDLAPVPHELHVEAALLPLLRPRRHVDPLPPAGRRRRAGQRRIESVAAGGAGR
jgi:hypothetical protein